MIRSKTYGSDSQIDRLSEMYISNEKKLLHLEQKVEISTEHNSSLKSANSKLLRKLKELSVIQDLERQKVQTLQYQLKTFQSKDKIKQTERNFSRSLLSCEERCEQLSPEINNFRIKYSELLKEYKKLRELYLYEYEQRKHLSTILGAKQGNIRVICRCRPSMKGPCQFSFTSPSTIIIPDSEYNSFQSSIWDDLNGQAIFNRVFQPSATQIDIFEEIKPLIRSCLDGQNVSVITHGPIRGGKTFTMQGDRTNPGITVRSVYELCELCQKMRGAWIVNTSVSMLELYNEVLYDLLSKNYQAVRLKNNGLDVEVVGAKIKLLKTKHEFLYWIGKGHAKRRLAANRRNNDISFRSHLIIQIHVDLTSPIDSLKRHSTLVFCDLAGKEDVIIRKTELYISDSTKYIENGFINRSLTTLGRVLEGLQGHASVDNIPYRNSKLTHLLQPCLNEQSKIVLLIAVSGEKSEYEKSLTALEFGQKVMLHSGTEKREKLIKFFSSENVIHSSRHR